MKPIVPDTPPPPATDIRPLREAEIRAASALVRRVFAEFEAPDYAQEGIDVFHRFIAPEALTEQFRTGALMLWGAFRQDTLAGVAAVRNRSHISLLFVDASCHRQGIARALFSAVRDFCRTDPAVSRITVNSSPYAVEIYRTGIHRNRRRTRHGRNPFYPDDIPIITAAAADASSQCRHNDKQGGPRTGSALSYSESHLLISRELPQESRPWPSNPPERVPRKERRRSAPPRTQAPRWGRCRGRRHAGRKPDRRESRA